MAPVVTRPAVTEKDPCGCPDERGQGCCKCRRRSWRKKLVSERGEHRAAKHGPENAADRGPHRSPCDRPSVVGDTASDERCDAFGDIVCAVGVGEEDTDRDDEEGLGGHPSAPPQLEPAPAVQPKQWLPVATRQPVSASSEAMSQMVRAPVFADAPSSMSSI